MQEFDGHLLQVCGIVHSNALSLSGWLCTRSLALKMKFSVSKSSIDNMKEQL